MNFLILFSFLYIIDFSYIIKSLETINNTNINCGNNQYYDSLLYKCKECPSGMINENICYTLNSPKSIYSPQNETICEGNKTNCTCTDGSLTELDDEGKILGFIMCAKSDVKLPDNVPNIPNFDNYNFKIITLTNPNRTNSEISPPTSITNSFYNHSEIGYYYYSCYNGTYKKSCQYLANLCVLSIYDEDYFFCKFFKDNNFGITN